MSITSFKIESNDHNVFEISLEALRLGKTLGTLVENLSLQPGGITNELPIPLGKVDGMTLTHVVEWSEHHKDDEPHNPNADPSPMIPQWDMEFFEGLARYGENTLFDVLVAGNYLDIPMLVDYACKFIGHTVRGKSSEEMCRFFQLADCKSEERAAVPAAKSSGPEPSTSSESASGDLEAGPSTSKKAGPSKSKEARPSKSKEARSSKSKEARSSKSKEAGPRKSKKAGPRKNKEAGPSQSN